MENDFIEVIIEEAIESKFDCFIILFLFHQMVTSILTISFSTSLIIILTIISFFVKIHLITEDKYIKGKIYICFSYNRS